MNISSKTFFIGRDVNMRLKKASKIEYPNLSGATRTLSQPPYNLKNCRQNFKILLYEGEIGNVNYYFC